MKIGGLITFQLPNLGLTAPSFDAEVAGAPLRFSDSVAADSLPKGNNTNADGWAAQNSKPSNKKRQCLSLSERCFSSLRLRPPRSAEVAGKMSILVRGRIIHTCAFFSSGKSILRPSRTRKPHSCGKVRCWSDAGKPRA